MNVTQALDDVCRRGRAKRRPGPCAWLRAHAALVAGVVAVAIIGCSSARLVARVERQLETPQGCNAFVANDASHYHAIAQACNAGDWRLSYVRDLAHRQPLYPLLLAVPLKWAPPGLFWLAMVNVAALALLWLCAYLLVAAVFESHVAGLVVLVLVARDGPLAAIASHVLMTEPLFVLLAFLSTTAFLVYAQQRQTRYLVLAAAASGLSYLTRPNGLFLAFALAATLAAADLARLIRLWRSGSREGRTGAAYRQSLRLAGRYLLFVAVFVAMTVPSWLPRLAYHGDSFYHGYLPNFMWADSYAAGHVQGPPRFTAGEYLAAHRVSDMVRRFGHGLKGAYWDAVVHSETGSNRPLFAVAVVGLVLSLAARLWPYWLLFAFMFLEMLPLVWTNLANPTLRIPYAALLPFTVIFAGYAVKRLEDLCLRWAVPRAPAGGAAKDAPPATK